jgi:hypothetical protein
MEGRTKLNDAEEENARPLRTDEPISYPAIRDAHSRKPDTVWTVMVPSRKIGDHIETSGIKFDLAPKRRGSQLMQAKHVEGVWAPGRFPADEDDWDHSRLVLLEVRFLTLLKFRTGYSPIPESGSLGDDDEPETACGPN